MPHNSEKNMYNDWIKKQRIAESLFKKYYIDFPIQFKKHFLDQINYGIDDETMRQIIIISD